MIHVYRMGHQLFAVRFKEFAERHLGDTFFTADALFMLKPREAKPGQSRVMHHV